MESDRAKRAKKKNAEPSNEHEEGQSQLLRSRLQDEDAARERPDRRGIDPGIRASRKDDAVGSRRDGGAKGLHLS